MRPKSFIFPVRPAPLAAILCLGCSPAASAEEWTVVSLDPGVSAAVYVTEDSLVTGPPWDADADEACPPAWADDVRCEWRTQHTGGDLLHEGNGVLAALLDGSAAQSAVLISAPWSDPTSGVPLWRINYDVHFVVLDPADLPRLRFTSRYQYAGVTKLTLNLSGQTGTVRVQHVVAPQHSWVENPETGDEWRIELTLRRTQPGQPAMIWFDNLTILEGPSGCTASSSTSCCRAIWTATARSASWTYGRSCWP